MTTDRIEVAIDAVCQELTSQRRDPPGWMELSEPAVFREFVAAILGSRVSFEMAFAATERLSEEGLLHFPGYERDYLLSVEEVLTQPLFHPDWTRCRRYRFPRSRSKALSSTAAAFYAGGASVKVWLSQFPDSQSARRGIVKRATGIGPKQASMILRNIRFGDELAILDSHLMRFMRLRGIGTPEPQHISSLSGYEAAERTFFDYARGSGWPTAILDLAIWVVMRVYSRQPA